MLRYAMTNSRLGVGDRDKAGLRPGGTEAMLEQVRRWAAEGIEYVQLREPSLTAGELLELTKEARTARDEGDRQRQPGDGLRTRLLVPRWTDAAVEGGADGVHLPGVYAREAQLEATIGEIRRRFRQAGVDVATVSLSCHTIEEVRLAARAGIDLVLYGPVFEKVVDGTAVRDGMGLQDLREACEAAGGMTVFALGGVTAERIEQCRRAGAGGIAGIRMYAGEGLPGSPRDAPGAGLPGR